jgi:hypothetical protein
MPERLFDRCNGNLTQGELSTGRGVEINLPGSHFDDILDVDTALGVGWLVESNLLRSEQLETLVAKFELGDKVIKVRNLHDHMHRASNSILGRKPWERQTGLKKLQSG